MSRGLFRLVVGFVALIVVIRLAPLLIRGVSALAMGLRTHWWLVLLTLGTVWILERRRRRLRGAWRTLD